MTSSLQTLVTPAKAGTRSVRATIPEGVAAYLGLDPGDTLDWKMEILNGKKVVFVTRAEVTEAVKSNGVQEKKSPNGRRTSRRSKGRNLSFQKG